VLMVTVIAEYNLFLKMWGKVVPVLN
jgi:hypothetical protein